ncbi:MAG: hypothetical protein AAGF56_11170 [Pseudomonadota bacterium]
MVRLFIGLLVMALMIGPTRAEIFQGERLVSYDGKPALVRFFPGSRGRPLVVLTPGGGTTARLFYGVHRDRRPEDFLATHLTAFGYNVLAVSIPIDTGDPVFAEPHPGFTIRDWGDVLANAAAEVVAEHRLDPKVILVGWSMAGKSAHPMATAAPAHGIEVGLFVSLAATPPVLGVLPIEESYPMNAETGYGQAPDPEYKGALWNLRANARANGVEQLIPPQEYIAHYVGEGPVGVSHTGLRHRDGAIIGDLSADIEDGQGYDFAGFPPVATIVPTTRHDLRHAMTDLHTWGMITTNRIYQTRLKPAGQALRKMSPADYVRLRELVLQVPSRLSVDIDGNHFFFVGEKGARQTAEAIARLEAEARVVEQDLDDLLTTEEETEPKQTNASAARPSPG